MKIRPVILCGGAGTRLWPNSKNHQAKQFIDFGNWTLLGKTLERTKASIYDAPIISTNKKYLKQIIEAYDLDKFILKPMDGFGGSGVVLLDKSSKTSRHNVNSLLDFYINQGGKNNYIILQEYIESELLSISDECIKFGSWFSLTENCLDETVAISFFA